MLIIALFWLCCQRSVNITWRNLGLLYCNLFAVSESRKAYQQTSRERSECHDENSHLPKWKGNLQ